MDFKLKAMPGTTMTDEEMDRQCAVVSEAAHALDYFTEDELEPKEEQPHTHLGGMECAFSADSCPLK